MLDIDPFDGRTLKRQSWAFLNLIGEDRVETWTPVLTFATPGNLSVAYSTQAGSFIKAGLLIIASFTIVTTTFTHTTAIGECRITGLPFNCKAPTLVAVICGANWQGITKANFTDLSFDIYDGTSYVIPTMSGSGQNLSNVLVADMPTGGIVKFIGTIIYNAGTA